LQKHLFSLPLLSHTPNKNRKTDLLPEKVHHDVSSHSQMHANAEHNNPGARHCNRFRLIDNITTKSGQETRAKKVICAW
jgi:hypothetical protein